jgi:hypothetical protein
MERDPYIRVRGKITLSDSLEISQMQKSSPALALAQRHPRRWLLAQFNQTAHNGSNGEWNGNCFL